MSKKAKKPFLQNRRGQMTDWRYLNTLPVAIRRKTTDEFLKEFEQIMPIERNKAIHREKEEAVSLALNDKRSLYDRIIYGYNYSTLNGWRLMTWEGARYFYTMTLEAASIEYANEILTVFFEGKWQKLKEVYDKI